jgi:hypothetical protein
MATARHPRLPCGCRRTTVRKRGHRPACEQFDVARYMSQRNIRQLRRKLELADATARALPIITPRALA